MQYAGTCHLKLASVNIRRAVDTGYLRNYLCVPAAAKTLDCAGCELSVCGSSCHTAGLLGIVGDEEEGIRDTAAATAVWACSCFAGTERDKAWASLSFTLYQEEDGNLSVFGQKSGLVVKLVMMADTARREPF